MSVHSVTVKTVGDLRAALAAYPEDIPIAFYLDGEDALESCRVFREGSSVTGDGEPDYFYPMIVLNWTEESDAWVDEAHGMARWGVRSAGTDEILDAFLTVGEARLSYFMQGGFEIVDRKTGKVIE